MLVALSSNVCHMTCIDFQLLQLPTTERVYLSPAHTGLLLYSTAHMWTHMTSKQTHTHVTNFTCYSDRLVAEVDVRST